MRSRADLDAPQFGRFEPSTPARPPFDARFTVPEAAVESSAESNNLIATHGEVEEAEDIGLVELRYQHYLALRQLEELFESGELLLLGR